MVKIYLVDLNLSSSNFIVPNLSAGCTYYNNDEGKTVLIETWTSTTTKINPTNNFNSYIVTSNVIIENLSKLNGNYMSTYLYDDEFLSKPSNEVVVYYIGLDNKNRLKVTYLDNFNKVIIKRVKNVKECGYINTIY